MGGWLRSIGGFSYRFRLDGGASIFSVPVPGDWLASVSPLDPLPACFACLLTSACLLCLSSARGKDASKSIDHRHLILIKRDRFSVQIITP